MSLIRPEILRALRRWREGVAGAGLVALGLYWMFGAGGLLFWIGLVVLLGGAVLIVAGIQRGRFRQGGGGPGVVTVVEGRIAYFGPLDGGLADLDDLTALRLDPTGHPKHWLLDRPRQPPLAIPITAEGADLLFDAFETLPGLDTQAMLRAMRDASALTLIWQRRASRGRLARPH